MLKGTVFEIERFAIEDGVGIRTVVFMKGCPLTCMWCCNPESQHPGPEIAYFKDNCIGCGKCAKVCPTGAISPVPDDGFTIDRSKCDKCGRCADVCVANSKVLIGKQMTVDEVLTEVRKDSVFYHHSGGGVTISGGEPTFQSEFVAELLRRSQEQGWNTAIETCGYTSWKNLEAVARYCDSIFYDLKHMDPVMHQQLTGVTNELILENLEKLAQMGKSITVRVPLIPDHNDSIDNVKATMDFIKKWPNIQRLEILPYHRLGQSKYERLDIKYHLKGLLPLDPRELTHLVELGEQQGIKVKIGG